MSDERQEEIVLAKARLEQKLGRPVEASCRVGGEERACSPATARAIADAGYRYAFRSDACPITRYAQAPQLRRSNVEAHWPMHRVGPRLSGLVDLLHVGGRRRMNGLTQVMQGRETGG